MRTIDPIPAQIASMDKGTVLRLLGLLTTGTLLKRGAEIQVIVSRWAWGLLARLPERGQLTSEEIGVVRELGKKVVLIGVGLKEDQQWEEGMDEVEAGFEVDYEDDMEAVNDEEIDLDIEDGLDELDNLPSWDLPDNKSNAEQKIGLQRPTDEVGKPDAEDSNSDAMMPQTPDGKDNGNREEDQLPSEELDAAKARILKALKTARAEEIIQQAAIQDEEVALAAQKSAARWNTKATVDMIITVAGEMYGQRDLLEFRQTRGDIEQV